LNNVQVYLGFWLLYVRIHDMGETIPCHSCLKWVPLCQLLVMEVVVDACGALAEWCFGRGRLTILIQHHLIHHRCCMGLIPALSF